MKTPDEIKKGLMLCSTGDDYECVEICPYVGGRPGKMCMCVLAEEALAYIKQLEQQNAEQAAQIAALNKSLEQVKRERDAALAEWKKGDAMCWSCDFWEDGICTSPFSCEGGECWEWRGVQEE